MVNTALHIQPVLFPALSTRVHMNYKIWSFAEAFLKTISIFMLKTYILYQSQQSTSPKLSGHTSWDTRVKSCHIKCRHKTNLVRSYARHIHVRYWPDTSKSHRSTHINKQKLMQGDHFHSTLGSSHGL